MAIIALSLFSFARPVQAAGTKVSINQALPIDSSTFSEDEADCGDFGSGVVWHFILNQYSGGAQLFGSFDSAGDFGPFDPSKVLQSVQHFYVNTPTDDTLTDAYVLLDSAPGNAQLVLSHVCHVGEASQSAEQSVEAGTGTPAASQPDTSLITAAVSLLPTVALSLILLASIGALAYANVKARR